VKFTTYHGLEHFRITEFPLRAALASEKLAELYLPVARKLCAETTPESEQQRLERIRAELADEIERALARRKRQSGTLELRAEPDGPAEPSGPDAR